MLHESYHKMYRHLITWYNLYLVDAECAAQALDYVINQKIYDENLSDGFAKLPKGGLLDEKFRGMNEAEVFNALREKKCGGEDGGKGKGDGKGDGKAKGDETGAGDGTGNGAGEPLDHHDFEGGNKLSDEEVKDLTKDIDEALRQGAMIAGKMGTGGNRDIDELLAPQIDWRQVLRDFITATCAGQDYSTWRVPNKKYMAGGLYMPSGVSEKVEEVCVDIDMSGSTWCMVPQFMGELKGVLEQVKPDLLRVVIGVLGGTLRCCGA